MMGIGTLANAAGIIIGGCIGLAFKKGLPERFRSLMFDAAGAAVFFIGISGVMSACLRASQDGSLSSEGTMVMLLSLVVGSVIGEAISIDRFFDFVSDRLKKAFSSKAGNIGEGFASTTILFCAGAMAIIGAIEDGAMGNPDLLYTKAVLDGISSIIFGAVFGGAVFLSAGSVVLYQGTITLLAGLLSPYLSDLVVSQMSLVGSAVLTLLAFDMWGIKKFNVANMIPAAFMPFFFSLV